MRQRHPFAVQDASQRAGDKPLTFAVDVFITVLADDVQAKVVALGGDEAAGEDILKRSRLFSANWPA